MEYRQRRLIAAALLVASLLIVAYLVFFSPSETSIPTPSATQQGGAAVRTPLPSNPETDDKRTAEAAAVAFEMTPQSETDGGSADNREMALLPEWMGRVASVPTNSICPENAVRDVNVSDGSQLSTALASAQAGDRIVLANGTYSGNFEMATSGDQGRRIWICGSRSAVIDSGGVTNGYALHITGSYVGVWGITISNAQKGIVIDGGDFVQIDNVDVHTTGDEAIRFRANATDGVVRDSQIHHTGLRNATSGEGIVVGSAVADWPEISDGKADQSDRIDIARNQIWDTSAEAVDIKEGTSGGTVEFNSFDGAAMTGADSWVDLKGNEYVLRGNVGINASGDGFQTHNINDLESGSHNQFIANTAQVNGTGYGFYIQNPDTTDNSVSCSNIVLKADAGFSNVPCSDAS